MAELTRHTAQSIGVFLNSPSLAGWLMEMFLVPTLIFGATLVFGLGLGLDPAILRWVVGVPTGLCLLANLVFLASVLWERRVNHMDLVYLRSYAALGLVEHRFTEDVGLLQLLVRGILRPPLDTVSLFPPGRSDDELERDRRLMARRGIHHVFSPRTSDETAWLALVEHLLRQCRLVVVECHDPSEGFSRELDRLPEIVDPGKVILIAEAGSALMGMAIKARLETSYRKQDPARPVDLPLLVFALEKSVARDFKERLMREAQLRVPEWHRLAMERSPPIMLEIVLKTLTMVLTFGWWAALPASFVAAIYLAVA